MKLACVVLAAGLGTRMKSSLPKVLHRLHGVPMLRYVLNTVRALHPEKIVIVAGEHIQDIKRSLDVTSDIAFARQKNT